MREIDLAMEEVGGGGEGLGSVGKHACHGFIDTGPVQAAVNPLAALRKGWEVERLGSSISAKVGESCSVAEVFI